jgi:hypothetical protein
MGWVWLGATHTVRLSPWRSGIIELNYVVTNGNRLFLIPICAMQVEPLLHFLLDYHAPLFPPSLIVSTARTRRKP